MLVFLDFEASSLAKQSYPVEVGWVIEDGSGEAHLIRPAPGWTDWDGKAELVHGLSRARLAQEGEPHDEVCARVLRLFEGNSVFASAPSWDGHWLSMLLRASGHPRHLVRLRHCDEAFAEAIRERRGPEVDDAAIAAEIAAARAALETEPVTHRALEDARREWRVWRKLARGAGPAGKPRR